MPLNKRTDFFVSEEGINVREKLQLMVTSSLYNTTSSYTPSSVKYPNSLISFVDKHMNYLNGNPKLDSWMYLANLRLMTRIDSKR